MPRSLGLVASAFILCTAMNAFGAPVKTYFLGDEKITSPQGKLLTTKALFIEKTVDPEKNFISERSIEVDANQKVTEATFTLSITGNDFTVSDDKKTLEGEGKLQGDPWKWTYFKAEYRLKNGMKIQDEDFMSDPLAIASRKTIWDGSGAIVIYVDMNLKAITSDTFTLLTQALLKK